MPSSGALTDPTSTRHPRFGLSPLPGVTASSQPAGARPSPVRMGSPPLPRTPGSQQRAQSRTLSPQRTLSVSLSYCVQPLAAHRAGAGPFYPEGYHHYFLSELGRALGKGSPRAPPSPSPAPSGKAQSIHSTSPAQERAAQPSSHCPAPHRGFTPYSSGVTHIVPYKQSAPQGQAAARTHALGIV